MRHCRPIKIILIIALILLPVEFLHAQDDPAVEYLSYDVQITVEENGDFSVREIQRVRYGGPFSEGFAEIPLAYVSDLTDVAVSGGPDLENLSPYNLNGPGANSFTLEQEGDNLIVVWQYKPTSAGDELTFAVDYLVKGGLWIYPDRDSLEWRAVPADRSGLDVPQSRVTVNLPFVLGPDELGVMAFGPEYSTVSQTMDTGQQVIFDSAELLKDGTAFQILVDFPHGLVDAVPQAWQVAEDEASLQYRIPAIDVVLALDEDGALHVSEQQQVRVVEGTMYEGFRRFTWLFMEGLDHLSVREGDVTYDYVEDPALLTCEDCFTLTTNNRYSYWVSHDKVNDEIDINDYAAGGGEVTWRFPPLVKGEETSFVIEFDALGTVSVNEEDQKLHWTVLPGYAVPVEETMVRLSLPGRLGLEDVTLEGPGTMSMDGGDILLTLDEPATDWSFQLTMPAGTTSAEKPAWQLEMETVQAQAEAYRERIAREKIVIGGGGILLLVLALLGLLAGWYLKGSRRWREMRGNYRTAPPSDLAPGLVAFLVDEKATAKGALATLLQLATLGLLQVDLKERLELERIWSADQIREGEKIKTPTGENSQIAPHIAFLYNSLANYLPLGTAVALDDLVHPLQKLLPPLYTKMGEDLVTRYHKQGGFQSSNKRPMWVFITAVVLFMLLLLCVIPLWNLIFVTRFPSLLIVAMITLVFVFLAWWIISLLRKTTLSDAAKKEAQRWLGFKAYLQEIQQVGDLAEAQEILDKYFDYAVALDVDERLLQQVRAMGAAAPLWLGRGKLDDGTAWEMKPLRTLPWYSRPWYRRGSWNGRISARPAVSAEVQSAAAQDGRPALQRLSDNLNGSISAASRSLTTVLNTAVGEGSEPVKVNVTAFGSKTELEWSPDTPVDQVIGDIMRKSQTLRPPRPTRSAGGGFRGGSGSSSFRSSSRSSSRSRSRSSSSRRSGGGGRRGFR